MAGYFWSGSNRPGEIAALAKHGQWIGVAIDALDKAGRGMRALLALAPPARMVVGVTRATGGAPILMFNRDRVVHAGLPTGDVRVDVAGRGLLFGFRKVAVNVARAAADSANTLTDLLRDMFGADAGARGEGHKVSFELTQAGWRMSDAELDAAKRSQSRIFVDSGAFGEVRFDVAQGRLVDHAPISHDEWLLRLAGYDRIATALGAQCYLVAPDKVGDQDETLRRLELYAPQVRALRAKGAQIIVPIQRGAMAGADFDRACTAVLGFGDYVRGIPSKKAAATVAEIAELSRSLPETARVHLLGLGPFGERYNAVVAALGRTPELVTCDSVRIKALVGRTNGPGGGPRILTRLTDAAKRIMGVVGQRLAPAEADQVKFRALDAYFGAHYQGAA